MPPTTPRCARVRAPLWSFFAASCSVLFSRVVSPRIKRFWFAVFDLPTLLLVAHVLPFVGITCTYERWVAPYPGVAGDFRRLPGRLARPPRPRTGDPSPATRGRDRVAKAHAARATLSAELGRDTGAGELAGRLG